VPISGIVCLAVLLVQIAARKYQPVLYWSTVAMVAIFGTMVADVIHIKLRVPYGVSTVGFAVALVIVMFTWHASERTLSIHSIRTRRREIFYWVTVVVTFALGTAAGDLTAMTFHLGYLVSGVVFTIAILIPLVGTRNFFPKQFNLIFGFWFAYILTRPLGASFADYFSKPSGLRAGDGPVAAVLFAIMILVVGYIVFDWRKQH
jgi:uncharacterized membrane-anchored protein